MAEKELTPEQKEAMRGKPLTPKQTSKLWALVNMYGKSQGNDPRGNPIHPSPNWVELSNDGRIDRLQASNLLDALFAKEFQKAEQLVRAWQPGYEIKDGYKDGWKDPEPEPEETPPQDEETPAPNKPNYKEVIKNALEEDLKGILNTLKDYIPKPDFTPREMMPDTRTLYVKPTCFDPVVHYLTQVKRNIWLCGPAGCGKSLMAKQIANALETNFTKLSFSGGIRAQQVFGSNQILPDGTTAWQPAPLIVNMQQPGIICLDELPAADPDVNQGMAAILDRDGFTAPDGKHYDVNPDCYFIATGNTAGRGKSKTYRAAQFQDFMLVNRFTLFAMDYEEHIEYGILDRMGLKKSDIRYFLDRLKQLRERIKMNQLDYDATTRALVFCATARLTGIDREKAFNQEFITPLSKSERSTIGMEE